jgi:methionine biosynthesis protein MetW
MRYRSAGTSAMRFDLRIIASWITPGARVLGLGCGEGELLYHLKKYKGVTCTGIDQNEEMIAVCIQKGLTVLQGDINEEVLDYPDDAFDYVVLSQTLQQIYDPSGLIASMLRVGKKVVVSFPNFSHWRVRGQVLLTGHAPVTPELPYQWHDTPNIRVITLKDFRKYGLQVGFEILKEADIHLDGRGVEGKVIRFWPELFAKHGIFLIGKPGASE